MVSKEKKKTLTNDDIFNDLYQEIIEGKNNTEIWRQNQDKWHRLRMRIKKTKNFPFAGCSNLRLPTIEKYLRKAKAALIGLFANVKPRMSVIPQSDNNLEKAGRIERFLDWLADVKMKMFKKLVLVIDKMLEQGFCIVEIDWKMEDDTYTETLDLDDL